ncbi:MAG: hypothetical protein IPI90_14865 [Saprospiraceae bacterium]|nr:hypothetical protein [Candidatus Vicinibacter affinis]
MIKKLFRILLVFLGILIIVLSISYFLNRGEYKIVNNVIINKPINEVFDFVADMQNELKWNPKVQFVEKKTDGDVRNGTKFISKWTLSDTLEVTVQNFDKPNHLTFINGGAIEVTFKLTLKSVDSSITEMKSEFIAKPNGFIRAIFPIISREMEKDEKRI